MTHAHAVKEASDLGARRAPFEPLSGALQELLAAFGNPTDAPLRVAFCPMAFENEGAHWVQRGERVDNAYFGDAMRTCGSIEETVAPGAHLEQVR